MIPFGKPKIDSLRILIPFNEVEIIGNDFLSEIETLERNTETAEIVSEVVKVKTKKITIANGIGVSYSKKYYRTGESGSYFIAIGFSAKLLKNQYLIGIDKNNIQTCYNYIISEGLINFTKESFLNAMVVDTDICIDIKLHNTNVKEVVSIASQLTIPRKGLVLGEPFKQKNNVGIEWSKREKVGRAYFTKQYLKYYAKLIELESNSLEFYNTYIKESLNSTLVDAEGNSIDRNITRNNWIRIETTISNNAHWETYGVQVKSLRDLIKTDLSKLNAIFNRPINYYMEGSREINIREDFSPLEKLQLLSIQQIMIEQKLDYINAIESLAFKITKNKKEKYRVKTKMMQLWLGQKNQENESKNITQLELFKLGLIP